MNNIFPRHNGKSTLALNFIRMRDELNKSIYNNYTEKVKNDILLEENQKLKELLKECRYKIIADLDKARLCKSSVDIEDFEYMLNRIDEALNEHIHSKQ